MPRLKIPNYAKKEAKEALELRKRLPKSKRFGLDEKEAKKKGINSGVARAKQIIRSDSLSFKDAKSVSSFYNRFKNCRTPKCEGAIKLWGGRKFGQLAGNFVKRIKREGH